MIYFLDCYVGNYLKFMDFKVEKIVIEEKNFEK